MKQNLLNIILELEQSDLSDEIRIDKRVYIRSQMT